MNDSPLNRESEEEELSLTPLLDCIFILVFFFLVATTLRDEEPRLEVNLPQTPLPTESAQPREALEIVITADGEVRIGQEIIAEQDLPAAVAVAVDAHQGDPVLLVGDTEANFGAAVAVMSALSHAGVRDFDILTDPGSSQAPNP